MCTNLDFKLTKQSIRALELGSSDDCRRVVQAFDGARDNVLFLRLRSRLTADTSPSGRRRRRSGAAQYTSSILRGRRRRRGAAQYTSSTLQGEGGGVLLSTQAVLCKEKKEEGCCSVHKQYSVGEEGGGVLLSTQAVLSKEKKEEWCCSVHKQYSARRRRRKGAAQYTSSTLQGEEGGGVLLSTQAVLCKEKKEEGCC